MHIHMASVCKIASLAWVLCVVMCSADARPLSHENSSQWSYQIGSDSWHTSASKSTDTEPGHIEERSSLLLPDFDTRWTYRNTSVYGWLIGQKSLTSDTEVRLKAQANQYLGLRLDVAQIEKHISPRLGFRFGVVDYKTSWCRNYESDSVWIRDVEPLCNFQNFRDIAGGAPGLQAFIQNGWGTYLLQAQAGIYRPRLWGYAPKEFGDLAPVSDPSYSYNVESNKKSGINLNVLDLRNGGEIRLSYIHGIQRAYAPADNLQSTTRQTSDAIYAAISFPMSSRLTGRLSRFEQTQNSTCRSEVAPFSQCNLNVFFKKQFTSIDAAYTLTPSQTLGVGVTRVRYDFEQDAYDPSLLIYLKLAERNIQVTQKTAAWRINWMPNFFTILQYIDTKQTTRYSAGQYPSDGWALGLRAGYQF